MQIRRPLAALLAALALFGGPAVLPACGDPSGGSNSDTRNDGTTDDDSTNTEGADPSDASQGNVPQQDGTEQNGDRNENPDSDKCPPPGDPQPAARPLSQSRSSRPVERTRSASDRSSSA